MRSNDIRKAERAVAVPAAEDAGLIFIGRIHTPWNDRMACPRQGHLDGPLCRIEVFDPWVEALTGIEQFGRLEALYWLHESRRDLVLQSPRDDGQVRGAFSLRTPVRPNPIATQIVKVEAIDGRNLMVRGMDCLNGTPLLDLKPDRTLFMSRAHPTRGDFDGG